MTKCDKCGGEKDCSIVGGCSDHYHCDCSIVRGIHAQSNKERFEAKQIDKALKKRGY